MICSVCGKEIPIPIRISTRSTKNGRVVFSTVTLTTCQECIKNKKRKPKIERVN